MTNVLSLADLRKNAPSIFAAQPHPGLSDRYKFISTANVVEAMMKNGFAPVQAFQSRTRLPDNTSYVKHLVRFRHEDMLVGRKRVGDEIPELVLRNSHNGGGQYEMDLGVFRLVCENGMVVQSANFASFKVRHVGNVVDNVIEGSFKVVDEAPRIVSTIDAWKSIELSKEKKLEYGRLVAEEFVNSDKLDVLPSNITSFRREEDKANNLWTVFNRTQENLIRGGVRGVTPNGGFRRLRGVRSVDGNINTNTRLWALTEKFAEAA